VPFWQHNLQDGLLMQRLAVHTHLITSWYAARLMVERRRGLIIEVTDGITGRYRESLYYDLAKASVIRLALAQAEELRLLMSQRLL
jgi:NAD(P)-dependent dehydrogenase (short-subunit alcohol dehydrogenase family)